MRLPQGSTDSNQGDVLAPGELDVVTVEIRRLSKAVETLGTKLDLKLDEMRAAIDARKDEIAEVRAMAAEVPELRRRGTAAEERLRACELELARVAVKISVAVGLAGMLGAGLAEGIAQLLSHH